MKKRIIAFVLALVLAAAAAGCSEQPADNPPKQTQPATQVPIVTVPPTQPATEAPTQPAEAVEFPDVTQKIFFPLLSRVGNAELTETGTQESGTAYLVYSNGSEADLNLFVTLCGYCGLFRSSGAQENGSIVYYLTRPGSDFIAVASLMEDGTTLYMQVLGNCYPVDDAQMQVMKDYYLQDLTLPTGYGPNVMPEFYASIRRSAADVDGLVSNIFSGEQETCWFELYYDVDYASLHRYLSDMMLCGFDIKYESAKFGEGTMVVSAVYMLNNGSSRVVVSYNAEDLSAGVYYEPGVDRYLFKGEEYAALIPQP